ncbi:hypothetical protein FA95DRAFT_1608990 [Auriscalpium vulgare]|uniref:Uncharacterized protein n=1 Tax=Auriscalpium vulgare TaxID=40419 RepID=A0ACB8RIZ8_9AGAM|nr:hypothetical protein FA95DRAFT_1608990 [Auriscalpium vulgare]
MSSTVPSMLSIVPESRLTWGHVAMHLLRLHHIHVAADSVTGAGAIAIQAGARIYINVLALHPLAEKVLDEAGYLVVRQIDWLHDLAIRAKSTGKIDVPPHFVAHLANRLFAVLPGAMCTYPSVDTALPEHAEGVFDGVLPARYIQLKLGARTSLRALYAGPTGDAHFAFVRTTHHNINSGLSAPQVEPWFDLELQIFTHYIALAELDGRISQFIIYYTHDRSLYPMSETISTKLPGRHWYGELLVFRRARCGTRLVNLRAGDTDVVWRAIAMFLDTIDLF